MNANNTQWLKKLSELEAQYHNQSNRRQRELVKEAFSICTTNNLPLPLWVAAHIEASINNPVADEYFNTLEQAYKAGNLGALLDAVANCGGYFQYPLPEWAKQALVVVLKGLIRGDNKIPNKWRAWAKQYKEDMEDLQLYELTTMARDGVIRLPGKEESEVFQWKHARRIAISIFKNRNYDDSGMSQKTLETSNKRLTKEMKANPFRYFRLYTLRIYKRHFEWGIKKKPKEFITPEDINKYIESELIGNKPRKGRMHKTD